MMEPAKTFALEEWKDLRQQINILLSAIWKLEMSTIAGLAIYYGWYFTYESKNSNSIYNIVSVASVLAPVVFLPLIIARLKIEYAILMRLGEYCERVENAYYGHPYKPVPDNDDGSPIGWQRFLTMYPPDDIPFSKVRKRYSHTFWFFIFVAFICTAFAFYRLDLLKAVLSAPC